MRAQLSGEVLLQEVDEAVGGRVVGGYLRVVLQLRLDLLGELLPELHPAAERGGSATQLYTARLVGQQQLFCKGNVRKTAGTNEASLTEYIIIKGL